jgi:hypothetical protein
MDFYMIQHKITKAFLPYSRHKRGKTHLELSTDGIPRLFKQRNHAQVALNRWLAGRTSWQYVADTIGYSEDYKMLTDHDPSRVKGDMEIIKVTVKESPFDNLARDELSTYARLRMMKHGQLFDRNSIKQFHEERKIVQQNLYETIDSK